LADEKADSATRHGHVDGDDAAATTATGDPAPASDVSSARAEQAPRQGASPAAEDVVAATLAALGRHGDTEVEVTGGGNPQPSEVRADWVAAVLAKAVRDGRVRVYAVHPDTGALLDPDDDLATAAYVPGEALKEVVRARDGRCRFPGCTVNVRFCDLDHVRPWPTGPTAASNLMALCRRHHRIKQMVGGCQVVCVSEVGHMGLQVGVDAVGVDEGELAQGCFPALDDGAFDELAGGLAGAALG
jgi:hypothetical protein